MSRQPAVANRFYPGSPRDLELAVTDLLAQANPDKKKALALVAPHAGYIYSGELAAITIGSAIIPETVIILGPNHHGRGEPVALSTIAWSMPLGTVPIDLAVAEAINDASAQISIDETAHQHEHSLEVQVPFLQVLQPNLHLVPIAVSQISYELCEEVARAIALVIKASGKECLILASTDLSHYVSRTVAAEKDRLALARITALDPQGLYQTVQTRGISMCGFIPVTIALLAAKQLGASTAELVGYTDSGDISGDTEQVVGYAGFIIS